MSDSNAPLADPLDPFAPTASERSLIRELIEKLKPSPLKFLTTELLDSEGMPSNFYDILAEHLDSREDKKWRERTVAAWAVGVSDIPEGRRQAAIIALRDILAERNRSKRKSALKRTAVGLLRTLRNALCVSLLFCIFRYVLFSISLNDSFFNTLMFLLALVLAVAVVGGMFALLFSFPASVSRDMNRVSETRSMAAKSLLRLNAMEALPELLEGAVDKSWEVQCVCREALGLFFPQMTETNIHLMPANSEVLLGRVISTTYETEYGSLLLDYLEKFGQGSSADAVSKHVGEMISNSGGDAAKLENYRVEVQRVLAILRERQNREFTRQELLRHSAAPIIHADQLLRPAADSQPTSADQLLRASNLGD